MSSPIRCKVARVLNSRELILNVGSLQSVTTGMYFDVLSSDGEEVKDPDTGEVLGLVSRPKVRVKVTSVEERLSRASTYRKRLVNIGGIGMNLPTYHDSFVRALMPPKYVPQYETIKSIDKAVHELSDEERAVAIGDPAVQVDEVLLEIAA